MKVCLFCDCDNTNTAVVCPYCGGNEFAFRCRNCGNLFESGTFCPKCGYSRIPANPYPTNQPSASRRQPVNSSRRPKLIWLWVLGWIYIFPVPFMILMNRNQKMTKPSKIVLIVLAWIVYTLIAIAAYNN